MADSDGDILRCRWANYTLGECAGVCNAFPFAILDEVSKQTTTLISANSILCVLHIGNSRQSANETIRFEISWANYYVLWIIQLNQCATF